MTYKITRRQKAFIDAKSDEVLFGGAAGGGKSFGQLIDAMLFALRYAGSRQLILRRTFVELDRTLVFGALALYPKALYSYCLSRRVGTFTNGSTIEFGYCDSKADALRYQSAEYDVIRFDELTHFTEEIYTYLISRVRGANSFPKQVKSTTNPGGLGHEWVKKRFIDAGESEKEFATPTGTRIFLKAGIRDNYFLMKSDPHYLKRLENLCESDRRALLEGEWNIESGRYFSEWSERLHVTASFEIPTTWRRFFVMDYGLDMLAGFFIALDETNRAYVYKEIYESGLIISEVAKRILSEGEQTELNFAPPDLWNRRQESGISAAELFLQNGLELTKAPSDRVNGWLVMKEWLKPQEDEFGSLSSRIVFFPVCKNAIRTIGAILRDEKNPNDCAHEPHELTHAPDAIRYFLASWRARTGEKTEESEPDSLSKLLNYKL